MSRRSIVRLCVAWLALAIAVACDQATDRLTAPVLRQPLHDVVATVIQVADVEQLYSAVNDLANEGAAIILAPGTYVLSVKDPNGLDRPNAGRLELQRDMSLSGVIDDRSAVAIDASGLPTSSFVAPFGGRTAVIRIGLGSNTIEWLTVVGHKDAAAGIATELPGTANTRIKVAHVVSGGSSRGVDVRNVGAVNGARRIDAEVIDNEFFGPDEVVAGTMSEGIRVANFINANGGVIVATLRGNQAYGFQIGFIIANNRSSSAFIEVRSFDDQFFANTIGCSIAGGLSQSAGVANSNTIVFEAHATRFVDNTASIPGVDSGGIRVVGGLATAAVNVTSGNTVSVSLWGTKVEDNTAPDFAAYGARQEAVPPGLAGTNNRVTITLHGVSRQIDVTPFASVPSEPAGTNTVRIIR